MMPSIPYRDFQYFPSRVFAQDSPSSIAYSTLNLSVRPALRSMDYNCSNHLRCDDTQFSLCWSFCQYIGSLYEYVSMTTYNNLYRHVGLVLWRILFPSLQLGTVVVTTRHLAHIQRLYYAAHHLLSIGLGRIFRFPCVAMNIGKECMSRHPILLYLYLYMKIAGILPIKLSYRPCQLASLEWAYRPKESAKYSKLTLHSLI